MTEETGFNSGHWLETFCRNAQTGTETQPPSYLMDTGSPFPPGDEAVSTGSWYLPSFYFRGQESVDLYLQSPHASSAWCLIKPTDNIAFDLNKDSVLVTFTFDTACCL